MIPFEVKKNYLIMSHRLIKPDLMKYFINVIFKFHNIIRYYQIVHAIMLIIARHIYYIYE